LALCCDFRIVAANARLGLPEINLGLIPGWGGTQRLPRLIGRSRALRMILSSEPLNAEAAIDCGLADELVPNAAELEDSALQLLARFSSKAGRSLGLAKRAVYQGEQLPLEQGLDNESELFGTAWDTAERREGISAFLQRRRPQWPED
jgi:enoyl-CoA hydratase